MRGETAICSLQDKWPGKLRTRMGSGEGHLMRPPHASLCRTLPTVPTCCCHYLLEHNTRISLVEWRCHYKQTLRLLPLYMMILEHPASSFRQPCFTLLCAIEAEARQESLHKDQEKGSRVLQFSVYLKGIFLPSSCTAAPRTLQRFPPPRHLVDHHPEDDFQSL